MHTLTSERDALMLLSHLTEPGDLYAGELVRLVGAVETVDMIVQDTIAIPSESMRKFIERTRPRYSKGTLGQIEANLDRFEIEVITPSHVAWPVTVNDLGDGAPLCLYVKSKLDWPYAQSVAIVGARAATSYGEHVAMELAAELSKDHTIVSGGAYGIDGSAHRASLAAGGSTIAVLAGGVDRPYPAGHAHLLERVSAVISEVPPGSTPTKWRFLQRNRIIAAIGQATIVVEAGFRSGSLNTAGHATALGRPLGAVPGPITSVASSGCHRLIREFSAACITSADDVRLLTGAEPKGASTM